VSAAAFFDLDRTLLRRSSALALAPAFRARGLISRRQVASSIVADSMERVLRPLVYSESLDIVDRHRNRGEPVYIVSATLQEIVQAIADDLGFDGALGTICEVENGVYTGRALRALHAEGKAACIRELGYDLTESTAYSDSHTDLPFLEAVGHPVAVNPDRALRRIAAARGWPVLEFDRRAA
jgi:HAD superfamily hydrolase (TIGR01490 family)